VVQVPPASTGPERSLLLKEEMERLVVKAKELSLPLEQLVKALEKHWKNL
jgi:GntR family transcriptional regulator